MAGNVDCRTMGNRIAVRTFLSALRVLAPSRLCVKAPGMLHSAKELQNTIYQGASWSIASLNPVVFPVGFDGQPTQRKPFRDNGFGAPIGGLSAASKNFSPLACNPSGGAYNEGRFPDGWPHFVHDTSVCSVERARQELPEGAERIGRVHGCFAPFAGVESGREHPCRQDASRNPWLVVR